MQACTQWRMNPLNPGWIQDGFEVCENDGCYSSVYAQGESKCAQKSPSISRKFFQGRLDSPSQKLLSDRLHVCAADLTFGSRKIGKCAERMSCSSARDIALYTFRFSVKPSDLYLLVRKKFCNHIQEASVALICVPHPPKNKYSSSHAQRMPNISCGSANDRAATSREIKIRILRFCGQAKDENKSQVFLSREGPAKTDCMSHSYLKHCSTFIAPAQSNGKNLHLRYEFVEFGHNTKPDVCFVYFVMIVTGKACAFTACRLEHTCSSAVRVCWPLIATRALVSPPACRKQISFETRSAGEQDMQASVTPRSKVRRRTRQQGKHHLWKHSQRLKKATRQSSPLEARYTRKPGTRQQKQKSFRKRNIASRQPSPCENEIRKDRTREGQKYRMSKKARPQRHEHLSSKYDQHNSIC